jgi:hypothetical protein
MKWIHILYWKREIPQVPKLNEMENQELMNSIFFEGNPLEMIRNKVHLDILYELTCLKTYLELILEKKLNPKHMIDFSRKLTVLNARWTYTKLEPNKNLCRTLHYLDQAISFWRFGSFTKWMDQLQISITMIDEFLIENHIPIKM